MKKIVLFLTLIMSVVVANAQIATENSKLGDNVSLGVTFGGSTPLDFNSVFPINTNVGVLINKDITPVIGVQLEGLALLNDNHFSDIKTLVKATNVGFSGVINLSNFFLGYKGSPRSLEIKTVTGLGWLHTWNTSDNSLTAKTGVDLAFNVGKTKAHSFVLTPAVYWNLHKINAIQFNKNGAQLALNISYIYHLKTSNGTRHFKVYDIGALNSEINRLTKELEDAKKVSRVIEKKVIVEKNTVVQDKSQVFVTFAQNSSDLTFDAKTILNGILEGKHVKIIGTASPEGTTEANKRLSQARADVVAAYLKGRGVIVDEATGIGVQGATSNRLVVVTVTVQ